MDKRQPEKDYSPPKNVIIIGGSLSGLMHGIMLHRLGSTVRVLEQSLTHTPVSHMAGVCLGIDVQHFLKRFDRTSEIPLGISAVQLQSLDGQGKIHPFLRINRIMSSWDALYFRLRANFDMKASHYVPHPPALDLRAGEDADGAKARARYEIGKQVIGIEQFKTGQLLVRYKDHTDGGTDAQALADLVLGADGPNSIVRKIFLKPGEADRKYTGYVAWRGVVPEEQVSEETREVFRSNITYSILKGEGGHVILYYIPGKGGSVEPGKRLLNFCWYTNVPLSSLDTIMTDINGKRHYTKLPPGQVRPEVWETQKSIAKTQFAPPYLEVIEKIGLPFLHLITDYCSPRASFMGGKVLLVGDAVTLLRPHIAYSTNQAAYHALLTEKLVTRKLTLEEWEYQVTTAAYLQWRRSAWFGEYFQRPLYISIGTAMLFWATSALAKLRIWMGWLPPQAI
ncbi:FAD/NAD(P)-binding domain-containing protein [Daldinia loculata]|uniref:FAD/NAD(P)-binding domain-containing protein n=1 Tax=Daldinia loculata TaxID=103429 RepID=UPI0020C4D77B|nr:FAD/NAD(P)-binding domain-containing protein [Daldinia loculata]KAI1651123.1 FAD/NAD(P)-binding domain-containing protein [Daldinia loculata]